MELSSVSRQQETGVVPATVPVSRRAMATSLETDARLRIQQARQIAQRGTCVICGAQQLSESYRLKRLAARTS